MSKIIANGRNLTAEERTAQNVDALKRLGATYFDVLNETFGLAVSGSVKVASRMTTACKTYMAAVAAV